MISSKELIEKLKQLPADSYVTASELNSMINKEQLVTENPMNPQNIKAGDRVRLDKFREDIDGETIHIVDSVGGAHGNKVYCKTLGHEIYAQCFIKVDE